MPRYRLVLYPYRGRVREFWFSADSAEEARGHYGAWRARPDIRSARLETRKGRILAGCAPYGTVPVARQASLPLERPR